MNRQNKKPRLEPEAALINNRLAGGLNNSKTVFHYMQNHGFNQQRCAFCKTDDLLHAVENKVGVFCRRCEQRAEFVRREHPEVITGKQEAQS